MASLESSPLLFATVLMDPPGSRTARQLGKTQVSSLLRFFFNGDIIVWRNFPEVLYPVARVGVHEFDFIPASPLKKDAHLAEIALKAKLQLAESLIEWKMSDSSHAIVKESDVNQIPLSTDGSDDFEIGFVERVKSVPEFPDRAKVGSVTPFCWRRPRGRCHRSRGA